MRLYDCAKVVRSKNAGPFALTIDLMFESRGDLDRVLASAAFNAARCSRLQCSKPRVFVLPSSISSTHSSKRSMSFPYLTPKRGFD